MNEAEVRHVLRAYGLGQLRETGPLDCDPSRPWRVSTASGEYVLRQCRLNITPADLAFEHGLADWLAEDGLPVPRALPAREGQTWVKKGGRFFALRPYLSGAGLGLLPLALRRQVRRWALFDQVDAQRPGCWRADEWRFSRQQIDLVDAACHLLAEG